MSSSSDDNIPVGKIVLWSVVIIVVLFIAGLAGEYTKWFGLAVTAQARVQNADLQTDNIISKQNYFFEVNQQYNVSIAAIARYDKQLSTDRAAKASDAVITSDLDGLRANQQTCTNIAGDYDGQAQSYNAGQFRSISLPQRLSLEACN